jgi:hypothetical protein
MIRVLLADDQTMLRAGLRTILAAHDDIAVVGEAFAGIRESGGIQLHDVKGGHRQDALERRAIRSSETLDGGLPRQVARGQGWGPGLAGAEEGRGLLLGLDLPHELFHERRCVDVVAVRWVVCAVVLIGSRGCGEPCGEVGA